MAVKFIFLVLPQLHIMDLAGPDQTIHEAIEYGADFEIEYCGINQHVATTAGLPIGKIPHFSKVNYKAGDYLFIPGSQVEYILSQEFKKETELLQWIKTIHSEGVLLCSICAGAFVLAQCGLLDQITCTTHFKRTHQLQTYAPQAIVQENILFAEQNGIYTSAGIASGIDMTLDIIEKLTDGYFAHKVARELVIYNRRDGQQAQQSVMLQFRNHIHAGIHKAQDFIVEHINKKHSVYDLADLACMSERNFTRVFKKETGITVVEYINKIRKEKVRELLKNPEYNRRQIATKVGLQSERQLQRILK